MSSASKSLRRRLAAGEQVVVCGAHDALSAKLVEEAGFDGIWASGFGLSAVRAVPDASILTKSETLEGARAMVEVTGIPVIADIDTGFGNAINAMHSVQDFEAAGIAAVCIEDNVFPKRCSFYTGVTRELAPVEEHARKIAAAKAAQRDPDFVVIARTEALIAGWGKEEALLRARAYADAGADAVLIHSKHPTFDELRDVVSSWDRSVPLVSVPTTYIDTPLADLDAAGFKIVIYANQPLRAAVTAMRDTLGRLKDQKRTEAEENIATLQDIYGLVGLSDLKENEAKFLMPGGIDSSAVILAAGDDGALGELTKDHPKCMLDIKGKTLLERQIEGLNASGIKDIAVVRGYRKESVDLPRLRFYDNDRFAETGELSSLALAENELSGSVVCLYGDVIFDDSIVGRLLRAPGDVVLVVDRALNEADAPERDGLDLVVTDPPPSGSGRFVPSSAESRVHRIGQKLDRAEANGEFIGMMRLSAQGAKLVTDLVAELSGTHEGPFHEAESLARAALTDLIQELIDRGVAVTCIDVFKGWMEVNTFDDYRRAWSELRS